VTPRLSPRAIAGTLLLGALAGCGGGAKEPAPPRDLKLEQASSAGTQAMTMELPEVAVRQYKAALARAYQRDDSSAIADSSYNLALAQMSAGDPKAGVATAQVAQAELERRRVAVPAELALVKAAAAYRAGDRTVAAAAAQQALELKAADPDTGARAWFIRGLVAADQSDRASLGQAITALKPSKSADLEADRLELLGRAALLDGQAAAALPSFEQAAANRQQALDYRGMTRVLALAGDSCISLDRTADAAGFFLRAGRSALLQGDSATALPLLKRAQDLAVRSSQTGIADEVARLRREAAARQAAPL
jgi:tetratricopeptide (TPR) repeat protein